jgi:VanZ family protein
LLSLALESAQMFLPARIASNVDLLANSGGALLGALGALLAAAPALAGHPLLAWRRRLVRADSVGDCGLIALAVWIIIQFDPAPLALASGDLRDALDLKPWLNYAPAAYQNVELCIGALAVIALGLLAAQLAAAPAAMAPVAISALLATVAAKSAAVWLLTGANSPWQWLTPGVTGGLLAGAALLTLLLWLPALWRSVLAIVCLLATVTLVNVTPENPYQSTPPFLLALQPSHLSSFNNILRLLSQLWPFAAMALLFALARRATPTSPESA